MKKELKEIVVYDTGDILDISKVRARHQKPALNSATLALVILVIPLISGRGTSYKVITDSGKAVVIMPEELGGEKYVGHIDMSFWEKTIAAYGVRLNTEEAAYEAQK